MTDESEPEEELVGIVASVGSIWITDPQSTDSLSESSQETLDVDKYKIVLEASSIGGIKHCIPNTTLCEVGFLKVSYRDLLFDSLDDIIATTIQGDILTSDYNYTPVGGTITPNGTVDLEKLTAKTVEIKKISAKTILDALRIHEFNTKNHHLLTAVLVILVDNLDESKEILQKRHGELVKELKLTFNSCLIFNALLDRDSYKKTNRKIHLIPSDSRYAQFPVILIEKENWDPIAKRIDRGSVNEKLEPMPRWAVGELTESLLIIEESKIINSTIRFILDDCNEIVLNLPKGTDLAPTKRLEMLLSAYERLAVFRHALILTGRWIQHTESRLQKRLLSILKISDKLQSISSDLDLTENHLPSYIVEYLEPALKDWLEKSEKLIQSRVEIEKVAVEERRAIIEAQKEERYSSISILFGTLVVFEILSNLISWAYPEVVINGWISWIILISFLVILITWGLNLLPKSE